MLIDVSVRKIDPRITIANLFSAFVILTSIHQANTEVFRRVAN